MFSLVCLHCRSRITCKIINCWNQAGVPYLANKTPDWNCWIEYLDRQYRKETSKRCWRVIWLPPVWIQSCLNAVQRHSSRITMKKLNAPNTRLLGHIYAVVLSIQASLALIHITRFKKKYWWHLKLVSTDMSSPKTTKLLSDAQHVYIWWFRNYKHELIVKFEDAFNLSVWKKSPEYRMCLSSWRNDISNGGNRKIYILRKKDKS